MSFDLNAACTEIATMHGALIESDGSMRWRFCQRLLVLRNEAGTGKETAEKFENGIGAACAKAVGRTVPYSRTWVRQHLSAARKFVDEPKTPEAAVIFLATIGGHKSRKPVVKGANGQKAPPPPKVYTPAELLALVGKWAGRAAKEGCTIEAIETALRDGIARAASKAGSRVRGATPIVADLGAAIVTA